MFCKSWVMIKTLQVCFRKTILCFEKQLLKWCSKLEMQRIKTERRREERHKAIYIGSFHKSEVVLSPLHFQGEFTKCNIWLQMLKHNCKRLLMLKNTIKRLLMLKHRSKRLLSNKITKKMFEVEFLTIQIRYRLLRL